MSKTYEMMFILRPNLTEDQVKQQMRKYYDFLKEHGADKIGMKVWGKRRLAYPIQRFQDGIYILTNYTGDGSPIAPMERAMRLSDEVLRYLTMKLKKDIEFEETEFKDLPTAKSEEKPEQIKQNEPESLKDTKPVESVEENKEENKQPIDTPSEEASDNNSESTEKSSVDS